MTNQSQTKPLSREQYLIEDRNALMFLLSFCETDAFYDNLEASLDRVDEEIAARGIKTIPGEGIGMLKLAEDHPTNNSEPATTEAP